ncbi:MAG: hypothetical protein RIF34_03650, partial [Candidatus Kapaibacterium sp.]
MFRLFVLILFFTQFYYLFSNDWRNIEFDESRKVAGIETHNDFVFVASNSGRFHYLHKSTDSGESWIKVFESEGFAKEGIKLFEITQYSSPDHLYHFLGMYERACIRKSTDGGSTFKDIYLDSITSNNKIETLLMYDKNIGIAMARQYIYYTLDGWQSFNKDQLHKSGYVDNAIHFVNDSTLYMLRFDGQFQTYNILSNEWKDYYKIPAYPDKDYGDYVSIDFVNKKLGFACGGYSNGVGNQKSDQIFRTTDYGSTWHKIYDTENEPIFGLNDIKFYDEYNGIAVGESKILFTNDGGSNWSLIQLPTGYAEKYEKLLHIEWINKVPIVGTFNSGLSIFTKEYFNFKKKIPLEFTIETDVEYCINNG